MKVAELIEKLDSLPLDAPVYFKFDDCGEECHGVVDSAFVDAEGDVVLVEE